MTTPSCTCWPATSSCLQRPRASTLPAAQALSGAPTGIHALDRTSVAGRTGVARAVVQIPDVLEDAEYRLTTQRSVHSRALLGVPILHERHPDRGRHRRSAANPRRSPMSRSS